MKIERKLEEILGTFGGVRCVPSEFHEAFPGGRFRPFSAVEIKGCPSEAERLLPPTEWNWDQTKAIMAFDQILSKVVCYQSLSPCHSSLPVGSQFF